MRVLTILIIAIGSAVVGAGLYSVIGSQTSSETPTQEIVRISNAPDGGSDKVIVAKGSDFKVTQAEIFDAYASIAANNAQNTPIEQLYPALLEQIINTKLIDNAAQENVDYKSEDVQQPLRLARDQILRNLYIQNLVEAEITDEKLKNTYEALVTDAPDVEQVRARHILVKEEEEAKSIIASLSDETDFAKLAEEKSIGPSAANGGDLGYFAKAEMVPPFAEAAFALDEGKVTTEPVQTQFGWHIIKVEEKRIQPKPSFAESRAALEQRIRTEIIESNINALRETNQIERFNLDGSQTSGFEASEQ